MELVLVFTKSLTQTDIAARLAIPTNKLYRFQIFNTENTNTFNVPVVDSSGGNWTFRCCFTRRNNHPAPVFRGEWLDFVRQKDLLVNDEVTFYEEVDDETGRVMRFRVGVKSNSLKLGGKVMTRGER